MSPKAMILIVDDEPKLSTSASLDIDRLVWVVNGLSLIPNAAAHLNVSYRGDSSGRSRPTA